MGAARERFSRDSYDDVGLRDIAGDAGVDAAMIHRYFGTKDDLFSAALDSCEMGQNLFDGPRDGFGRRLADQIVFEPKRGAKLLGMRIMLRSIGSAKAAEIVQASANAQFFQPFAAWLGGEDADIRTRVLAGLMMGMGVSRELAGGYGLSDSDGERLRDRLAVIFQSIVDESGG